MRWINFSLYKIRGVGFGTSSLVMIKSIEEQISLEDQNQLEENAKHNPAEDEKIMLYNISILKRGLLFFNSCIGVDYSCNRFYIGLKTGLNLIPGLTWKNQMNGNCSDIKTFNQFVFNGFVSLNVGLRLSH